MGKASKKKSTIEFDFNSVKKESDKKEKEEAATVVIDFETIRNSISPEQAPIHKEETGDLDLNFQGQPSSEKEEPPQASEAPSFETQTRKVSETELHRLIGDEDQGIDLGVEMNMNSLSQKLFLFDLKGNDLENLYANEKTPGFAIEIIKSLRELNQKLKTEKNFTLVFYYNQSPKAINKLLTQIRAKFSKIRTVIIAKNLSQEKAEQHKRTASGADLYLSSPLNFSRLVDEVQKA